MLHYAPSSIQVWVLTDWLSEGWFKGVRHTARHHTQLDVFLVTTWNAFFVFSQHSFRCHVVYTYRPFLLGFELSLLLSPNRGCGFFVSGRCRRYFLSIVLTFKWRYYCLFIPGVNHMYFTQSVWSESVRISGSMFGAAVTCGNFCVGFRNCVCVSWGGGMWEKGGGSAFVGGPARARWLLLVWPPCVWFAVFACTLAVV